ncbi:HipA domain-containing protein [Rhizobacter sp. P5_C2]
MEYSQDPLETQILQALTERGVASSPDLQVLTGKSQPTISRALRRMGDRVLTLGQGRAVRYGVPHLIRGLPAQQPLWWIDQNGVMSRWGTLSFLAGDRLHVAADGIDLVTAGRLPWFLSPLRMQGFLGREWARRLGLEGDPERWSVEQVLFAAGQVDDPTGALSMGEPRGEMVPQAPIDLQARAAHYDTLAANVAGTLPAGSSAGGEQAKFLTALASGERVLVKFTPPRGTPFGERWHDLLHTEALALQVMREHGQAVAEARILHSGTRTYLESTRFDRFGPHSLGRRHAVTLDAAHEAFVHGPLHHWAATCDALATQRRLSAEDASAVRMRLMFGRLIGNTDMHFGNLALWADEPAKGRFALAPLYDMLPMRWRPDAFAGLHDYSGFAPPMLIPGDEAKAARVAAVDFWRRLGVHEGVDRKLRDVAKDMADRVQE